MVTTRISKVQVQAAREPPLQDRGQGAGQAGLDGGLRQGSRRGGRGRQGTATRARTWCRCSPARPCATREAQPKALKTRPPARYSEATLLGAMEGAGKLVDDDELREAMQEKGLGTPATRAAIIEGLLNEKYMLREGRELIPTAKAFQLMTLLRGLGVEELSKPALTGEWEHKLSLMERGQLSREAFMREIASHDRAHGQKAKEYDRDSVPGNYATLQTPCPNCGGVVKENYRRYSCTAAPMARARAAASRSASRRRAHLRDRGGRILPARQADRPAGRLPLQGRLALRRRDAAGLQRRGQELEAGVRLRRRQEGGGNRRAGRLLGPRAAGRLPQVRQPGAEHGSNYVCEQGRAHAGAAHAELRLQERHQIILQQPRSRPSR
jgi:DNA topoisomerase III